MVTEYAVEIEVPHVHRDNLGTRPVPEHFRWALVADWTGDRGEAEVNYAHLLAQGLHVRLVRVGSLVLEHWQDGQRKAARRELAAGKSRPGALVVHPSDLPHVMARQDFISVFSYSDAEPGEVGKLIGPSLPVASRVFVSNLAPLIGTEGGPQLGTAARPLPRLRLPSLDDLKRTVTGLEKLPDTEASLVAGPMTPDSQPIEPALPKATLDDIDRVIVKPIVDEFVKRSQPLPQVTGGVDISKVVQPIVDDAVADAKAHPIVRPYVFGGAPTASFETSALTGHVGMAVAPVQENSGPEPPAEQELVSVTQERHPGNETGLVAEPETQPDLEPLPKRQTGEVSTTTAADVQAVLDGKLNPGDPGYIAAYQAAQVLHRVQGGTRVNSKVGS